MDLFDDSRDLLIELADAHAELAVVVGHAVAFHGHPRATKGRRIPVIGRAALLANERASGRTQDLADVEALERIGRRPR